MIKRFQAYGLMAGITLGFAVWGAAGMEPGWNREDPAVFPVAARPAAADAADAKEAGEMNLHALSAVLMDADSGRILYGKDERTARPMASTTKIMTCILALENGSMEDICTVSSNAAGQPKDVYKRQAPKKETVKKAPAAKKAPVKKAEPAAAVVIEYAGKQIAAREVLAAATKAFQAANKGVEIKTIEIYVKPEENVAYYVVNGEGSDDYKIVL